MSGKRKSDNINLFEGLKFTASPVSKGMIYQISEICGDKQLVVVSWIEKELIHSVLYSIDSAKENLQSGGWNEVKNKFEKDLVVSK